MRWGTIPPGGRIPSFDETLTDAQRADIRRAAADEHAARVGERNAALDGARRRVVEASKAFLLAKKAYDDEWNNVLPKLRAKQRTETAWSEAVAALIALEAQQKGGGG